MTLANLISFMGKTRFFLFFTIITLVQPLCVLFSRIIHPFSLIYSFPYFFLFFYTRLFLTLFSFSCPFHRAHAGWSAWSVVLLNMHSPFLLLYYCPTGGGGPFLRPDNGQRRDREHGGHVPFATPCYLSILPPFSPTIRFSVAP